MKRIFRHVMPLLLLFGSMSAQDSTMSDQRTISQNVALYTMTGVIVPLAIAGTAISFFPPSGGIIMKDGAAYGAMSIETGYGDGEKLSTGEFTDYRISLSYTHIFSSKVRDLYRAEYKRDFHFDFLDRRKIFLAGVHLSGGIFTDFPHHGFSAGAGAWIKSPWLSFFGFFPSHTYGVTYRYNAYISGNSFHEISLGVTSALTF